MERSSYLLLSKRKRLKYLPKNMNKTPSTPSSISDDSLEADNFKNNKNDNTEDVYLETVMVPFYENDVLIKIPKSQKQNVKLQRHVEVNNKKDKSATTKKNYLINHLKDKKERNSYLEAFRKRFPQFRPDEKLKDNEIDSMCPEFGDTECDSIGEESCPDTTEFYNTEVYNELFYEKLLAERFNNDCSLNSSLEDQTTLPKEIKTKRRDTHNEINSKIQSERPRRQTRRRSTPPKVIQSPGGLGPDMEKIRPRLERARSLQRYSEKVRMENRLKIYKNAVQKDKEKAGRENLRQLSAKKGFHVNENGSEEKQYKISYLVNRTVKDNITKEKVTNYCESKAKSAGVTKRRNILPTRDENSSGKLQYRTRELNESEKKDANKKFTKEENKNFTPNNEERRNNKNEKERNKCISIGKAQDSPSVQINFSVNIGRMKTASHLKALEEKHRLYQEKVKSFMVDYHVDD